jgi:hypothetical protein
MLALLAGLVFLLANHDSFAGIKCPVCTKLGGLLKFHITCGERAIICDGMAALQGRRAASLLDEAAPQRLCR